MNTTISNFRPDRCPADSYEEILDRDAVRSPDFFRQGPTPDVGAQPVRASRYYDHDFFMKEVKYIWPRVWHWACREEIIPNVGDFHIYEFAGKSFIIVRTQANEIKALYNSCLHRARQLVTQDGCRRDFRCPYHGITWNTDGSFKENPIGWDFPLWNKENTHLPEAKVELWGGFVFINMDHNAKPLAEALAPIPEHFARYDLANRYVAMHIVKKVRANWKANAEAFMESHHVVGTHPQALPSLADANSQYDILSENVTRQFSAAGIQSPFLPQTLSEQEIFNYMRGGRRGNRGAAIEGAQLPEGVTARAHAAALARETMKAETGYDYSQYGDAEMLDPMLYNVFPHLSFWAGVPATTVYRWRPNGLDPESAIMDLMTLRPCPKDGPRPPPAPTRYLDFDEPFASTPEFANTPINAFDQDCDNLPYVQAGMRASGTGLVHFGNYTELRLRYTHHLIDRYIAEGEMMGG